MFQAAQLSLQRLAITWCLQAFVHAQDVYESQELLLALTAA